MNETLRQLEHDFFVLDLGSAHAAGILKQVPGLTETITLVEVDALLGDSQPPSSNPKRISLNRAVGGKAGRRLFKQRKFPECSSFLDPKPHLITAYELQDYFVEIRALELECETIGALLKQRGVPRIDFFKTDLEGVDLEVLSSAPEFVSTALCVQSELRFQPFYQGEPPFHEVVAFLDQFGFEIVSLRPQVWKYATSGRDQQRDGRTVWADTILFLSSEKVRAHFGDLAWKGFAKQIILARLLGLGNFAGFLHRENAALFPAAVREELAAFVRPEFQPARALAALVNKLPFGWAALGLARRFFGWGFEACSLYRDAHVAKV